MPLRKDGQPDRRAGRAQKRGAEHHLYKHGMATDRIGRTGEYRSWRAMKARCTNPKDPFYDRYGGRGITVHPAWLDSFETFLADMGPRPQGTSLDRIDNNAGYSPTNCRWVDRKTQARNTRSNHYITVAGVSRTIGEWAEMYKLDPGAIMYRVRVLGWDYERAVTAPKMRNRSNRYALK